MFLYSCAGTERQVVPNDYDSENVYKALEPNEEEYPGMLTFGADSVPGFSIRYEIPTDSSEVYIHIEEFTAIDTNPAITVSLLSFLTQELSEYGFTSQNDSTLTVDFNAFINSGLSQEEATVKIMDKIKEDFYRQVAEIYSYEAAFNIVFNIYPVYINHRFITFREAAYCYTGGAHGNTTSRLLTFDMESGLALTLDDIFKADQLQNVREDVAAHMAYSYPIYDDIRTVGQYIDSLNMWLGNSATVEDESNAMITASTFPLPTPGLNETGAVFIYPMYELTPGSDGCPVVVLPYSEIKDYLKITK